MTRADAPRRVALVTAAVDRGGAEVVMETLARRLPAFGVHPVMAGPESGRLPSDWAEAGFETCALPPASRLRRVDRSAAIVGEIARRLRERDVAVVHTHGVAAHLHAGLAARRIGVPAVYHVHDLFESRWTADGVLQRLALRVPAARVVAISATVAAPLRRRVRPSTLVTILDGVSDERVPPAADRRLRAPLVVWCGRLQRWKGAHHFVDAAKAVRRTHPDAMFVVVGDALFGMEAEYPRSLRARVRAAGLDDALLFVGHVPDARPWLAAADVFVHCSDRPEPFGLVIAEAMMQERPVVAFGHGGAAEIVDDGITGVLTPPGDADALARAIAALLVSADRRAVMGQAGRRRAIAKFGAEVMTASVAAVYDAVARGA